MQNLVTEEGKWERKKGEAGEDDGKRGGKGEASGSGRGQGGEEEGTWNRAAEWLRPALLKLYTAAAITGSQTRVVSDTVFLLIHCNDL